MLGEIVLGREGKSALISGLGLDASFRKLAFLNPSCFVLNNVLLKFVISLWIPMETAAIRACFESLSISEFNIKNRLLIFI